jgi:hypothetical protein
LVVRGAVAQDAPDRAAVADLWWIDPAVPPVS